MNKEADSPVDCFLIDSCANDNIHKDFRKAIGANCIFYSAQTHELIVLVSTHNTHFSWVSPHEQVNGLVAYSPMRKWYKGAVVTHENLKGLNELYVKDFLDIPHISCFLFLSILSVIFLDKTNS